jgi:CheY-like chemotaxis protein
MREEFLWLKDLPPGKPMDLAITISEVLDLARPLAAQRRVNLASSVDDAAPNLAVHPVALTQALLSLLTVAVNRADYGGHVNVTARPAEETVSVFVQTSPSAVVSGPMTGDELTSLGLVSEIAALCGGTLDLPPGPAGAFSATLSCPILAQVPVLVIDDHADTLQLLQRYVIGTRYRLVTTRDPEQAFSLAEKVGPVAVVLDVMMPQVDGWHVLGRLREHPLTTGVPVIVCTILAEEALALSLGASDFIRKPVTRQAFLAALDRQASRAARQPR